MATTTTDWTVLEKLLLAQAVNKYGEDNWLQVARTLKQHPLLHDHAKPEIFNQKNCSLQYYLMIDDMESESRRQPKTAGSIVVQDMPKVVKLARQLYFQRVEELKKSIKEDEDKFMALVSEIDDIKSGAWDTKLARLANEQQIPSSITTNTEPTTAINGDQQATPKQKVNINESTTTMDTEMVDATSNITTTTTTVSSKDETTEDSKIGYDKLQSENASAAAAAATTTTTTTTMSTPPENAFPSDTTTTNTTNDVDNTLDTTMKDTNSQTSDESYQSAVGMEGKMMDNTTTTTISPPATSDQEQKDKVDQLENTTIVNKEPETVTIDQNTSEIPTTSQQETTAVSPITNQKISSPSVDESLTAASSSLERGTKRYPSNQSALDEYQNDSLTKRPRLEKSDMDGLSPTSFTNTQETTGDVEKVNVESQTKEENKETIQVESTIPLQPTEVVAPVSDTIMQQEGISDIPGISSVDSTMISSPALATVGSPSTTAASPSNITSSPGATPTGDSTIVIPTGETGQPEKALAVATASQEPDGTESVTESEGNAATPTTEKKRGGGFVKDDQRQKSWQKNVNLLWREIANHKNGAMFMNPIKEAQAPLYYDVVKYPMDLKTIKNRIRDGVIRTTVEFERDVVLMLTNSLMYNKEGTEIYQMALEMLQDVTEQIKIFKTADGNTSTHTRSASLLAKDTRKSIAE